MLFFKVLCDLATRKNILRIIPDNGRAVVSAVEHLPQKLLFSGGFHETYLRDAHRQAFIAHTKKI